jgi:hypothetical protein
MSLLCDCVRVREKMKPTAGHLFLEKIEAKSDGMFDVAGSTGTRYQVIQVGKEVSLCKKGDFVLVRNVENLKDGLEEYLFVSEDDLIGVTK